ncbi:hypothetical protein NUM3379_01570 [Kineococcus sp. NUM-3379]
MSYTWVREPGDGLSPSADAPLRPAGDAPGTTAGADDERYAKAGRLLEKCYVYLRDNAEKHPRLEAAITEMHSAVAAYASRQAADPLDLVRRVVATIEAQRRADPSIPQP